MDENELLKQLQTLNLAAETMNFLNLLGAKALKK